MIMVESHRDDTIPQFPGGSAVACAMAMLRQPNGYKQPLHVDPTSVPIGSFSLENSALLDVYRDRLGAKPIGNDNHRAWPSLDRCRHVELC